MCWAWWKIKREAFWKTFSVLCKTFRGFDFVEILEKRECGKEKFGERFLENFFMLIISIFAKIHVENYVSKKFKRIIFLKWIKSGGWKLLGFSTNAFFGNFKEFQVFHGSFHTLWKTCLVKSKRGIYNFQFLNREVGLSFRKIRCRCCWSHIRKSCHLPFCSWLRRWKKESSCDHARIFLPCSAKRDWWRFVWHKLRYGVRAQFPSFFFYPWCRQRWCCIVWKYFRWSALQRGKEARFP